jgi:hypothetical protein
MKRTLAACLVVVAVLTAVIGTFALVAATSTPVAAARPCHTCPLYCIGVTCDDGRTYCNSCLAGCAGAHHCVVTG